MKLWKVTISQAIKQVTENCPQGGALSITLNISEAAAFKMRLDTICYRNCMLVRGKGLLALSALVRAGSPAGSSQIRKWIHSSCGLNCVSPQNICWSPTPQYLRV